MSANEDHAHAMKRRGAALMDDKRFHEAKILYTDITAKHPDDVEAWYTLSTINGMLGDIQAAGDCARRALALQPGHYGARINLGNVLLNQRNREGSLEEYRSAVKLNPTQAAAHCNLGYILNVMGKYAEAAASYRTAISLNPNLAEAYSNLGNILLNQGAPHEAIDNFHRAISLAPALSDAHNNLGNAYHDQGSIDRALPCFQRALDLNPLCLPALKGMGLSSRTQAQFDTYIAYHRKAVDTALNPAPVRAVFIDVMGHNDAVSLSSWLEQELLHCFYITGVNHQPLSGVTARTLKNRHNIPAPEGRGAKNPRAMIDTIGADELFLKYLETTINTDSDLERLLTEVRRALLLDYRAAGRVEGTDYNLVFALARQCLNNEYVFSTDDDEYRHISDMRLALERAVSANELPPEDLEHPLLIFAMYEGPSSLSCARQLAAMPTTGWSEKFRPLIETALTNPLLEQDLKREIRPIAPINDTSSRLVQSQYEENPYPRWLEMPRPQQASIKRYLRRQLTDPRLPAFLDGPIRILIAGCGTGKHPIQTALSYANTEVMAVDISMSSLAYAMRMARRYGVDNIEFAQGDILQLSTLDERFHIVECVGVLHHMDDPLKGWRILSDLIVEDGLMFVGLYSQIARQDYNSINEIFKNEDLRPDRDNIRKYRRMILDGAPANPWLDNIDFYSSSGCRDLLFHFKEHRFTLDQIRRVLSDMKLEFMGFVFGDTATKNAYRHQFPQDPSMTNLTSWDAFERQHPMTFSNMYQFWCRKLPR